MVPPSRESKDEVEVDRGRPRAGVRGREAAVAKGRRHAGRGGFRVAQAEGEARRREGARGGQHGRHRRGPRAPLRDGLLALHLPQLHARLRAGA